MPFRARNPLVNLDSGSIHNIDTRNVMHLHGLWSVLNKCADAMEDGKRLENLSWRLFSRETFCCAPDQSSISPRLSFSPEHRDSPEQLPQLSSSVESSSSDEALQISTRACPTSARPELRRNDSAESRTRKQQHITPIDLEKIVVSIKSNQDLVPLSPLPPALVPTESVTQIVYKAEIAPKQTTPQPSLPPPSKAQIVPDSSTSTVITEARSDISDMSPPLASSESNSTDISATSIVRGFSKDCISLSARSRTQLAPSVPTPSSSILKTSPLNRAQAPMKRKGAIFELGGSSGEGDESSLESRYMSAGNRSSLTDGLKRSSKKTTSFNDALVTMTIQDRRYESEDVFEESDEEEDIQSGSAIEDEDVDEWEDEDEPSSPPSLNEREMFQRVDSKPNLVSRRSLLTSLMHEKDRAAALQNAASRSTPAIRRSRTTSPNGPLGSSPSKNQPQGLAQASRARPIIMTTSNTHPPALSPRTTRRNMLSTELTESLRKHLLWDRQVNRSTTNAALKRRHTANDMTKLKNYPGESQPNLFMAPMKEAQNTNSWNNYFDTGLQEYHQKGW